MSRTLVQIMSEGEARTQAHMFRNLAGVTAEAVYAQRGCYAVLVTVAGACGSAYDHKTVCLTWDETTEYRTYLCRKEGR